MSITYSERASLILSSSYGTQIASFLRRIIFVIWGLSGYTAFSTLTPKGQDFGKKRFIIIIIIIIIQLPEF